MRFASCFLCIVAFVLASCGSSARTAAADDLSGTYRFEGIPRARPENFPNPLVDWSEIARHTILRIEQRGKDRFEAQYTDTFGRVVRREVRLQDVPGSKFRHGVLSFQEPVPLVDAPMLPGRAKQFAGTRFFKDPQGNLRVIGFFKEKGWMFYLVPFSDQHEYDFVLEAVE